MLTNMDPESVMVPTERFSQSVRDWYLLPQGYKKYPRLCGWIPAGPDQKQHKITAGRVSKRISKQTIRTTSGSLYQLDGPCDKTQMRENGFSAACTHLFQCGFPMNWKCFVDDELSTMSRLAMREPTALAKHRLTADKHPRAPIGAHKKMATDRPDAATGGPKKTPKKHPRRLRTVNWYTKTLQAVTRVPSPRRRAAEVLFSPAAGSDALPTVDWSSVVGENFSPVRFHDTTRTFRMSAGKEETEAGCSQDVPSNASNASARLNFRGFLEQDKRHGKVRNPSVASQVDSDWCRPKKVRFDVTQLPTLPQENEDERSM